jgi:hypothetical protein
MVRATFIVVNLKFHSFIEINYSKIIHNFLFFNRVGKENKLICRDWASTEKCTSQCTHPAKKRTPFL